MNWQKFGFPVFVLLMLALPALPIPDFWITQLNYIGLYAIVSLGLVLLTGVAGLTSFGQAAFVGVGAYTAAFLAIKLGMSPWLTLFIGVALSVVVALVLGAITLRMSASGSFSSADLTLVVTTLSSISVPMVALAAVAPPAGGEPPPRVMSRTCGMLRPLPAKNLLARF